MAFVATVTKKSITQIIDNLWNVTLNMVVEDDAVEVINKDYSVHYRPGDSFADRKDTWIAMMQADIDKYKSEQEIFNLFAFDMIISMIQGALVV